MRYLLLLLIIPSISTAQTGPHSTEAILASLKTMGKALNGCREVYTRKGVHSDVPFLQVVAGKEAYDSAMTILTTAEQLTNGILRRPEERMAGSYLVAGLSTVYRFSILSGAMRGEILSLAMNDKRDKALFSLVESI